MSIDKPSLCKHTWCVWSFVIAQHFLIGFQLIRGGSKCRRAAAPPRSKQVRWVFLNRFLTTECFKLSWSLQTLFAGAALGRPGAEYNGKFELLVPNSSRCGDGGKSLNLIAVWPRKERISGMLKWGLHYHVTQYELSSHTDDRLVYFILVVFFFNMQQHARYWVCGSSLYSCTAMCPQCQSVPVF